ncbi:Protein CBG28056 [Caenorhabditis briggsae]|uniref:Protein CBG28056 n=1 Tax=Caenorhabditis briggsae TaxID=6238 RepID=B6IGP6_CAEBR|nr:Protein CBG28056 [Caenorhabditis briggsae]CAR99076.1 Protein CBG28056 [Caenorhabditis briggsae]
MPTAPEALTLEVEIHLIHSDIDTSPIGAEHCAKLYRQWHLYKFC